MDNLKLPAYPIEEKEFHRFRDQMAPWTGFSKLELASLMIAQGIITDYPLPITSKQAEYIKEASIMVATMILEGANK